jgi:hypothetical protein
MESFEINLTEYKVLNELRYATFGSQMKRILRAMFGGEKVPLTVKGSRREVDSFFDALVKEKKYMTSYLAHGLDDPRTLRNRAKLKNSVTKFERETGIIWPFK